MRKPLVAGNWKMHGSREFVASHLQALQDSLPVDGVEVAVFPPFVYLAQASAMVREGNIALGAQTLCPEPEGAFTGEVSGDMLRDVGCSLVLVGHSERRQLYGEDNKAVAARFAAALKAGLTPVLCLGETLAEREADKTLDVVGAQLRAVMADNGPDAVAAAIIAYEPVWAIGTGKTATPEQAQAVHGAVREMLPDGGQATRILYGGSVKAANAAELFSQTDIDGALVGGASLVAAEFADICIRAQQGRDGK